MEKTTYPFVIDDDFTQEDLAFMLNEKIKLKVTWKQIIFAGIVNLKQINQKEVK